MTCEERCSLHCFWYAYTIYEFSSLTNLRCYLHVAKLLLGCPPLENNGNWCIVAVSSFTDLDKILAYQLFVLRYTMLPYVHYSRLSQCRMWLWMRSFASSDYTSSANTHQIHGGMKAIFKCLTFGTVSKAGMVKWEIHKEHGILVKWQRYAVLIARVRLRARVLLILPKCEYIRSVTPNLTFSLMLISSQHRPGPCRTHGHTSAMTKITSIEALWAFECILCMFQITLTWIWMGKIKLHDVIHWAIERTVSKRAYFQMNRNPFRFTQSTCAYVIMATG